MSEKVPEELKEFVLRDIRILDKPRKNSSKYKVKDALDNEPDPVEKVLKYQNIMKEHDIKPDAERWQIAFDSYKYYKCFGNDKYVFDKDECFIYCKCSGLCKCYIRITADLLTGPKVIIDCAKKLLNAKGDEEQKKALQDALNRFCSVAYTVGNCCPVMKNPGGKTGTDTCWYKLSNYLDPDNLSVGIESAFCRSERRGVINDLSNRDAKYMFVMFPGKVAREEVIKQLILQDYCTPEYLELTSPEKYAGSCADYVGFLNKITLPIIKRGIRIYYSKNRVWESTIEKYADEIYKAIPVELPIQTQ